jgi:hypothetical protein
MSSVSWTTFSAEIGHEMSAIICHPSLDEIIKDSTSDNYVLFKNLNCAHSFWSLLQTGNARPNSRMFSIEMARTILKESSRMNKLISACKASIEVSQLLIGLVNPHSDGKRYFPVRENDKRKSRRMDIVNSFCEMMCDDKLLSPNVFSLEKFLKLENFGENDCVSLHKCSRRSPQCYIPAQHFMSMIVEYLKSDGVMKKLETVFKQNSKLGNKLPSLELLVLCPNSRESKKCDKMVHIQRDLFISFIRRFDKSQALKKHSSLFVDLDEAPIEQVYDEIVKKCVQTSTNHRVFKCPKGCTPTYFEISSYCMFCSQKYDNLEASHYHDMYCSTCFESACGLCSEPLEAHIGKRQLCKPKLVISKEIIEAGLQCSPPILYCPSCSLSIEWAEGCAHITCPCGTHFCAQCYQHLPLRIDENGLNTRYIHLCPRTFASFLGSRDGTQYYHNDADESINDINPASWHIISSGIDAFKYREKFFRKLKNKGIDKSVIKKMFNPQFQIEFDHRMATQLEN